MPKTRNGRGHSKTMTRGSDAEAISVHKLNLTRTRSLRGIKRRRVGRTVFIVTKRIPSPNVPYRLSEVVHRLGRGPRPPAPATAGEQLRRPSGCSYLESGRRTNLTLLSQLTSLIRLFDGDRTQSYSHAYSDAGISCLALYDLQPVTDHAKNQPHETKQPS